MRQYLAAISNVIGSAAGAGRQSARQQRPKVNDMRLMKALP